MDTIIYRQSDRVIAAIVPDREDPDRTTAAVVQELSNVLGSELGGEPEDYRMVVVDQARFPGKALSIGTGGGAQWQDTVQVVELASVRGKLLGLGLTGTEIDALRN